MKRNWYTIFSLLAMFAILLGACASPATQTEAPEPEAEKPTEAPKPAEVQKITFMAQGGDDSQGQTFEAMTKQFNETVGKEKGIEVEYVKVPADWPEYVQKVVASIAAGDAPDMINLSPLTKMDFTTNDYLLDLNPLMEADNVDASQWYPPTFDAWKDDQGKLFGFGHGIYTEAIYYNKDLFEKAGLTAPSMAWDESWTWEEMADYARKLTEGEGATKQYGLFVEPQLGWMTPIFKAYCGSIGVPDGSKLDMDSEGSVAALKFLTDLMWKDETAPRAEVTGATSAYELFLTGRLAMFWDGSWMMPGFANDIKDFEWGVLPLPKGECGTYTGYWVDAYAIPAASKNPDAAFEFMKFMVGDEASSAYVDQGLFGIPGKISVAEARANDLFKPLTTEEAKVWLDSANYGSTPEYTLNWNEVWDTTNKIIQRVQLGEITAEEAGKLMVDEADRIIQAAQQ